MLKADLKHCQQADGRYPSAITLGLGIGKLWIAPDAFSLETGLEIQKLFEAADPKFENLGPKPARKKTSR